MERIAMEYLVNSMWQAPLIAGGAWAVARMVRPGPQVRHRMWVSVLGLMVAVPVVSLRWPHGDAGATVGATAVAVPFLEQSDFGVGRAKEEAGSFAALRNNKQEKGQQQQQGQQQIPSGNDKQKSGWMNDRQGGGQVQGRPQIPFGNDKPRSGQMRPGLVREVRLGRSATLSVVGVYVAAMGLMALRLMCSWWATRRVVARARPAGLSDAEMGVMRTCCARMGVSAPEVLISGEIWSPVVVGVMRPALLLPGSFADPGGRSERELGAVWLHELAHIRRRDYLANLVCRVAALPVAYHPATYAVQRSIRQTREMVCDAMAAEQMDSPLGYARCLVELARSMQAGRGMAGQIQGAGMFDGGVLEERVMQLTKANVAMSGRMRALRLAGCGVMLAAVIAAAAMFHVTPMMAQAEASASAIAPGVATTAAVTEAREVAVQAAQQTAGHAAAQAQAVAPTMAAGAATQESMGASERAAQAAAGTSGIVVRDLSQQVEDAERRLDYAAKAWSDTVSKMIDRTDSAKLAKQMAETEAWVNSAEFKKQTEGLSDVALKRQMEDATAKMNSPEFRKQMEQMSAELNDPEFRKRMESLDSAAVGRALQDAETKFNNPEFKKMMEQMNGPELKKQMEDSQRQVEQALAAWNSLADARAQYEAALRENQMASIAGADDGAMARETEAGPNEIAHVVRFELDKKDLLNGDSITIDQVLGTSDTFAPGNMYQVKGTYKLASHDRADLAAYVTTKAPSEPTRGMRVQSMSVAKGEGRFTLLFYMWEQGDPHVSFYPAGSGSSFDDVYFDSGKAR